MFADRIGPDKNSRFQFATDESNGCLIGPDGCHYDNERAAFHFAFLGLCGCGDPEGAYNFCRDALMCFDRREAQKGGEWQDAEEKLTKLICDKPDVAAHVLAHLLTNRNLLEHGGNVGGSWLTEWGHQLVDGGAATDDDLSGE